jgi:hypothetical protein
MRFSIEFCKYRFLSNVVLQVLCPNLLVHLSNNPTVLPTNRKISNYKIHTRSIHSSKEKNELRYHFQCTDKSIQAKSLYFGVVKGREGLDIEGLLTCGRASAGLSILPEGGRLALTFKLVKFRVARGGGSNLER